MVDLMPISSYRQCHNLPLVAAYRYEVIYGKIMARTIRKWYGIATLLYFVCIWSKRNQIPGHKFVFEGARFIQTLQPMWTTLLGMTVVDTSQISLEVKILIGNVTQMVEKYFYTIFDVVFAYWHILSSEYPTIACIGIFGEK